MKRTKSQPTTSVDVITGTNNGRFVFTTPSTKKCILTNDPSITAWGWAVVEPKTGKVIECGAIKTEPSPAKLRARKGDDRVRRITDINRVLIEVIKKHNISLILSELPHGSQSAVAALMIGIVTGIMQAIGDSLSIPVEWYSEGDAKVAVCGKRSIPKDDMVDVIDKLFKERIIWKRTKWENQAIADSLAVYYVARQQSTALKMLIVTN
jgi:Holliday junction resolvasome RuvABC endonuclease subunit